MERPGHTRRCATVASFRTWRGSRPRVVPTTSCCSELLCSGEGGIRTHDTLSDMHAFQACAFNRSATSPASGERRIRTYGTVAGTPDFESGAFDHSASSPITTIRLSLPQLEEELLQHVATFGREHAGRHLHAVVVARLGGEIVERADRARLRISGAEHQAIDSR